MDDIDTTQAIRYYRTERAERVLTNRRLARGLLLLGYDAFHLVDPLMTQPLQVVLAGRVGTTGSYEAGMRLWEMAPNPVDLMVVDGRATTRCTTSLPTSTPRSTVSPASTPPICSHQGSTRHRGQAIVDPSSLAPDKEMPWGTTSSYRPVLPDAGTGC